MNWTDGYSLVSRKKKSSFPWQERQIIRLFIPLTGEKFHYFLDTKVKNNLLTLVGMTSQKKKIAGDEDNLSQHIVSYEEGSPFQGHYINTNTLFNLNGETCYRIWKASNRNRDILTLPQLNELDFTEFQEKLAKCFSFSRFQKYIVQVIF